MNNSEHDTSPQWTELTAGCPVTASPLIVLYELLDTAGNALLCLLQLLQQFQALLLQMALVLCQALLQSHLILGQGKRTKGENGHLRKGSLVQGQIMEGLVAVTQAAPGRCYSHQMEQPKHKGKGDSLRGASKEM